MNGSLKDKFNDIALRIMVAHGEPKTTGPDDEGLTCKTFSMTYLRATIHLKNYYEENETINRQELVLELPNGHTLEVGAIFPDSRNDRFEKEALLEIYDEMHSDIEEETKDNESLSQFKSIAAIARRSGKKTVRESDLFINFKMAVGDSGDTLIVQDRYKDPEMTELEVTNLAIQRKGQGPSIFAFIKYKHFSNRTPEASGDEDWMFEEQRGVIQEVHQALN